MRTIALGTARVQHFHNAIFIHIEYEYIGKVNVQLNFSFCHMVANFLPTNSNETKRLNQNYISLLTLK